MVKFLEYPSPSLDGLRHWKIIEGGVVMHSVDTVQIVINYQTIFIKLKSQYFKIKSYFPLLPSLFSNDPLIHINLIF